MIGKYSSVHGIKIAESGASLPQPNLVDVHASWASSARSYVQCHCKVGDLYCHS